MRQINNCTAEDLARAAVAPGYTGGTYAVNITPSAPGGFTFTVHRFVHSGRYAVGGGAREGARVFPASAACPGDVGAITRAIRAVAAHSTTLGLWRDSQGRLWIDTVHTFDHVGTALAVALERGELAIWDGIEGEEIAVNPEVDDGDDDGPLDPTRAGGLYERLDD